MILCAQSAAIPPRASAKPRAPVGATRIPHFVLLSRFAPVVSDTPASRLRARASPAPSGGSGASDSDNAHEQQPQPQAGAEQLDVAAPSSSSSPSPATSASASASDPRALLLNPGNDDDDDLGVESVVDAVLEVGPGTSVVLLRLLDGTARVLPIFIGEFEAASIARALALGRRAASAALGASAAPASSSSPRAAPAARPQTYDLLKSTVHALGRTVAHVRVVDIKDNTYYACVSLAEAEAASAGGPDDSAAAGAATAVAAPFSPPSPSSPLVEIDARPSDAINLALRCGCAVYVARPVAERCAVPEALLSPELQQTPPPPPPSSTLHQQQQQQQQQHFTPSSSSSRQRAASSSSPSALHHHHHHNPSSLSFPPAAAAGGGESHAEIVRTARAALSAYHDPTPMLALARDIAAAQERFEAAAEAQAALARCVTRDGALRLAAAVEAALADGRYAEAARLRDELLSAVEEAARQRPAGEGEEDGAAGGR